MSRTMRGRHCAAGSHRPARVRAHRSDAAALRPRQQVVAVVLACVLASGAGGAAVATVRGTGPTALTAVADRAVGHTPAGTDASKRTVDGEVLDLLLAHYYKPVDAAALRGTRLDRLPAVLDDRYTHYLMPQAVSAVALSDTGRYSGVGVVLAAGTQTTGTSRGTIRVTDVVAGSPAARAGIAVGDTVDAVDGARVTGTPLADVLAALRGDAGTEVALTVRRAGRTRDLVLTRALLTDTIVSSRVVRTTDPARDVAGPTVGYVKVAEFDERTGSQVRSAVTALRRARVSGLVLDLRGNPGGLVEEAVRVVSAFAPAGSPVFSQHGRHVRTTTTRTDDAPVSGGLPVVVLVDDQTASSGEIVAGALHDDLGAPLVGRRTFGKGVIQRTWPIEDGALKITVAEYLTPSGRHVDRTGLAPDVVLPDPAVAPERLGGVLRRVR